MGGHEALQGAPKGVHGKAKGGEDGGGGVKGPSLATIFFFQSPSLHDKL